MPSNHQTRTSTSRSVHRREGLKRILPQSSWNLSSLAFRPELVMIVTIVVSFVIVASALVIWSRDQIKVGEQMIMTTSRLNRLTFKVPDEQATATAREEARKNAPRIYKLNTTFLDRLRASLTGLPAALAERTAIDQVSPELRESFGLKSDQDLRLIQRYFKDGTLAPEWTLWVEELVQLLISDAPLIDQDEWEKFYQAVNRAWIDEGQSGGGTTPIGRLRAVQINPEQLPKLEESLRRMAVRAGFPMMVAPMVVARLISDLQPTFLFDQDATTAEATKTVAAVQPVEVEQVKDKVIYGAGDVLTLQQLDLLRKERAAHERTVKPLQRWLPRLGAAGLIAVVALLMAGYIAVFYRRVARNVLRVAALCALITGMLAITVLAVQRAPSLLFLAAVAPTLLVAVITLLAYDQRLGLFVAALQCMLVTLALEQGAGLYILLFAGCATMIGQLRDVRHRKTLMRASMVTALMLGIATAMLRLLELPSVEGLGIRIAFDAALAAGASFVVGFLVLGILPTLERMFDITTGMTLAELRDPKHPLLRQLQQKAPGTYNHSLQVANIAEAAAEAVGGNGLLVYVGALYHDIGKINKPDYFIENQAGGSNRHDKLSPAMSLLVLVGHVKDGIELAREYGLPRPLIHFIESHHGTTLVEYFYHAARTKAEAEQGHMVDEVEFRYPGPKPQTKEAAILMLADVVESATRTMAEPNPGRIENLVRKLSRKRLQDGQFDRSDLTFRELGMVEDSIIKSVCAIYHGRISYPTTARITSETTPTTTVHAAAGEPRTPAA